jgi:hypothetical protein
MSAALLLGSQSDLVLELCGLVPECVPPLRDLRERAHGFKYQLLTNGMEWGANVPKRPSSYSQ